MNQLCYADEEMGFCVICVIKNHSMSVHLTSVSTTILVIRCHDK